MLCESKDKIWFKNSMAKKIIVTVIILLSLVIFFLNRNSYIESFSWKSNSTNSISDFIEFNKGYQLKGKKIVYGDKTYGTIWVCLHKYLIVTNSQGQLCLYSNKGKIGNVPN